MLGLIKAEHAFVSEDRPDLAGLSSLERAAWYWEAKQAMDLAESKQRQAREEAQAQLRTAADVGVR